MQKTSSVTIINKLAFERAKLHKVDILKRMDIILFPNGDRSLLEMDCDEANAYIEDKMKSCMKKDNVYGCFYRFAETFSGGLVTIEMSDTIQKMVDKLLAHQKTIADVLSQYVKKK
jgi:hypothetical protein